MSKLYTTQLLALAAELAHYPIEDQLTHRAEARSRTCGSVIEVGLALDDRGAVCQAGAFVNACAIGQSSAAIFASAASGRPASDFVAALQQIEQWLSSDGPLPQWPRFEALAAAKDHPGRHGALLLPWNAAASALSTSAAAR